MEKKRGIFGRYLDEDFITHLISKANDEGHWWRKILDDEQLFIAIREDSLNVYYHGCSLLKLEHMPNSDHGKLYGETNKAYLVGPSKEKNVISWDGKFKIDSPPPKNFYEIDRLMRYAREHYGIEENSKAANSREKTIIQKYLKDQLDVIDVEVAVEMRRNKNTKERKEFGVQRSPRIDIVQLSRKRKDGPIQLNFIEVKHIDNAELRASKGKPPKVIKQLKDYAALLRWDAYKTAFKNSYKKMCCDLVSLGVPKHRPGTMPLTEEVGNKELKLELEINEIPQLLILRNKDEPPRNNWNEHHEKLKKALGDCYDEPVML